MNKEKLSHKEVRMLTAFVSSFGGGAAVHFFDFFEAWQMIFLLAAIAFGASLADVEN